MKAAEASAKLPILIVSSCPDDHASLSKVLRRELWDIRNAFSCEEAHSILQRTPVRVILTEAEDVARDICWRKILAMASKAPYLSKPHVIVVSAKADERLWSEVLNLGGYNVLAKPLDATEICWVFDNVRLENRRMEPALVGEECQRLSA